MLVRLSQLCCELLCIEGRIQGRATCDRRECRHTKQAKHHLTSVLWCVVHSCQAFVESHSMVTAVVWRFGDL